MSLVRKVNIYILYIANMTEDVNVGPLGCDTMWTCR
jgi:hypothetical protein